jgi:hypothetical protein
MSHRLRRRAPGQPRAVAGMVTGFLVWQRSKESGSDANVLTATGLR